jgi:hypothetical protein
VIFVIVAVFLSFLWWISMNSGSYVPLGEVKCPYCFCVFFSRSDLNNHLKVFGLKAGFHGREFVKVHKAVVHDLKWLHGGADRVIRAFERIIEEDKLLIYQ